MILLHDPSAEAAGKLLRRILTQKQAPTSIFLVNPFYYLTTLSILAEIRAIVPRDLSIITTYGDPFVSYALPDPCRYDYHPLNYARSIHRTILRLLSGETNPSEISERLIPEYMAGKSIAAPRERFFA